MFDVIGPINYSAGRIFAAKKIKFTFHKSRLRILLKGEGGNHSSW